MAAAMGVRAACGVVARAAPEVSLDRRGTAPSRSRAGVATPLPLEAFRGLSIRSLPSTGRPASFAAVANAQLLAAGPGTRAFVTMGAMEAGIGVMANKVGMMTWFSPDGKATTCTVLGMHEGNIVTQLKTPEIDGYSAVQVGYKRLREDKLKKPEWGHLNKVGVIAMRHLQEFKLQSIAGFEPGQALKVEEIFKEGDLVDVSGKSIGKGFQGGIKVHNFARGAMTHGSKSHRQLGSIGAGSTPGRVYPGKKMPRQLGNAKVKIRKLTVIKVDPELHAIILKGAVPGKIGNLLRITPAKIVGKNIPKN